MLRNLHKSLFGVIWKAVVYSHSDEKLVGKYVVKGALFVNPTYFGDSGDEAHD